MTPFPVGGRPRSAHRPAGGAGVPRRPPPAGGFFRRAGGQAIRAPLDQWFDVHRIEPHVVGEVEDLAVLQTLGEHGLDLFAAPTVVRKEICRRYHVTRVGELDRVRERLYAISVERRISHPAIRLIADQAKRRLFT